MPKHLIMVLLAAVLLCGCKEEPEPRPEPRAIGNIGPYVEYTAPDRAVVRWHTDDAVVGSLEYGFKNEPATILKESVATSAHEITVTGLNPNTRYEYRVMPAADGSESSPSYEIDNFCNYSLPPLPERNVAISSAAASAAKRILDNSGVTNGIAILIGAADGQLAYELARQTSLSVIILESDEKAAGMARSFLLDAGIYGPRVSLRVASDTAVLPQNMANLLVCNSASLPVSEIERILKPGGIGYANLSADAPISGPAIEGAGEWTHQYGAADNSACSLDELQGVQRTSEMDAQWLGRPGADATMDRNPRKPAPLAADGRVFLQGLRRIIAMDAFNGTILWSRDIPELLRVNMPRDCGNWVTDGDYLYAAINKHLWRIDAASGEVVRSYSVDDKAEQSEFDWGYIASVDELLLGSKVLEGAIYKDFFGSKYWYDGTTDETTHKVCSEELFALGKADGARKWSYGAKAIINSTITVGGDKVYFLENRNPSLVSDGRVGDIRLWQDLYLVGLELESGAKVLDQPVNIPMGTVIVYMNYTDEPEETLVVTTSSTGVYFINAYGVDGKQRWQKSHFWMGADHGGHMQHPVLLGGRVYQYPFAYNISDGAIGDWPMPIKEGCPTFAAGKDVFVYRGQGRELALWNRKPLGDSMWTDLRPGCWLSAVPALGMVLAPEGGGGCSCGRWIETSVAFSKKESE